MTDPQKTGEQMAEDTVIAVEEAINDWVEDDETTAYREGGHLVIDEEELVEKITIMVSMAIISFTEN